jgi:hypothetical protein
MGISDLIYERLSASRRYLDGLHRQVSGDPGALRWAAGTHEKFAQLSHNAESDLYTVASRTPEIWQGWAADAFMRATAPIRQRTATITWPATWQLAAEVHRAADALERARTNMEKLIIAYAHADASYRKQAAANTAWQNLKLYCTVLPETKWWRNAGDTIAQTLAAELTGIATRLDQMSTRADTDAVTTQPRLPESPQEAATMAAAQVRQALRGHSPEQVRAALEPLRSTIERILTDQRNDHPVSAADLAYVQALHNDLGSDTPRATTLLDAANPEHRKTLKALGDSVNWLSNQKGPDGQPLTPRWVTDLLTRPGIEEVEVADVTEAPQIINIWYHLTPETAGFAKSIGASELIPGHDLALGMAQHAGQMFEAVNKMNPGIAFDSDDGRAAVDTAQVQLVNSASANHTAMADLFRDARTTRNLLTGEWTNDGATVTKLFAWIGTPGAGEEDLARNAYLTLTDTVSRDEDDTFPAIAKAAMKTNPKLSTTFALVNAAHIDLYAQLADSGDTGQPYSGEPGKRHPPSIWDAERMLVLGSFSEPGSAIQGQAATEYGLDRLALAYQQNATEAGFNRAGREAAAVAGAVAATEYNARWFESIYDTNQRNAQRLNEFYHERQALSGTGTGLVEASGVVTNFIRDGIFPPNSPWGALAGVPLKALNSYLLGGVRPPDLEAPAPPKPNYHEIKMDVSNAGMHVAAYQVILNRIARGELDPREARIYNPVSVSPATMEDAVERMKEDPRAEKYIDAYGSWVQHSYRTYTTIRTAAPYYIQLMHKDH